MESVLELLAGHLVGLRQIRPAPETTRAAVRAVVDWFAAAVPGGLLPPARLLATGLRDDIGVQRCRLVPDGTGVDVRAAALVNGTAAHAAELDDIYRDGLYHPGAPTIAAALAVAESLDSSGDRLLRAVTAGYEIGCRVAEAVSPEHYRFWHTTGTIGTIGAAAAAADLLDLDRSAVAHALATATTMSAGLQQAFRSDAMSKALHAGHAAEAGTIAALAAARGVTGALDVFDGRSGLAAATAPGTDPRRAVEDLDAPLRITRVTIKAHACCGHTFAAIDAVLAARSRVRLEDVQQIEIDTYGAALEIAGTTDPRTAFEAKFSLGYCVAAALVRGSVGLDAFADDALHDPLIRSVLSRIVVREDPALTGSYPRQRAARVEIRDANGDRLIERRDTRHGDPDDPLTDDELRSKFTGGVQPVLGPAATVAMLDALWQLPALSTVRALEWRALSIPEE